MAPDTEKDQERTEAGLLCFFFKLNNRSAIHFNFL